MKNVLKVVIICIVSLLNVFTSCEEDECEKSEINAMTVDIYAWGTAGFVLAQNMENITSEYAGSHFSIQYQKTYCDGSSSDMLGFDYFLLANGDLDKDGAGNYSFTMKNEFDYISFYVYYHEDGGFGTLIGQSYAYKEEWDDGKIRCEVFIYGTVYDGYEAFDVSINYVSP